jgi:hypothetical protein
MVDVKSMSSFGFKKYSTEGLHQGNDSFGYRWQVAFYHYHMVDKGEIQDGDEPYLLGIDKQLGHIALIPVNDLPSREEVAKRAAIMAKTVTDPATLPARGYDDVPDGASGNRKLDIACSYCDFKDACWPDLRTFIYSNGPKFLTKVAREPKVPEAGK